MLVVAVEGSERYSLIAEIGTYLCVRSSGTSRAPGLPLAENTQEREQPNWPAPWRVDDT
jgi:hypothetical protein